MKVALDINTLPWFKVARHLHRKAHPLLIACLPPTYSGIAVYASMRDVISHSVTEQSWNNELGGLIIRPRPERKAVIQSVSEILQEMGDISLTEP